GNERSESKKSELLLLCAQHQSTRCREISSGIGRRSAVRVVAAVVFVRGAARYCVHDRAENADGKSIEHFQLRRGELPIGYRRAQNEKHATSRRSQSIGIHTGYQRWRVDDDDIE